MIARPTCPDASTLEELAKDKLPSDQVRAFEGHLAQCRDCLDRFVALGQRDPLPSIKDCHLVAELGRGRFGVVYKAWSLKGKPRLVALKLLSFAGDMEADRFDREIRVLKEIDSPNIVRCFDSGSAGGTPYYLMELVRGVHLDEYLAVDTSSLDEKLRVFQRMCLAVAQAHARNVIHRDLKPKNILIDEHGQPHILDFGICAMSSEGWTSSARGNLTQVGDIIGTLKYMSPEQAWGGVIGPIDERSDVWALGIMLYEIATGGDYPYALGSTHQQSAQEALLERIRKEAPRPASLGSIERGRDLETLLERCLAWEPAQRIASVARLAEDIERYREGRRIVTRRLATAYRARRLATGLATRSRWAALVAVVAMLATTLWTASLIFRVQWREVGYSGMGQTSLATAPIDTDARAAVVVAGVFDDTAAAVIRYAFEHHLGGVTSDVRSWRAVHGHLMERLVAVEPAAVVWDYYFRSPRPGDAQFVQGVRALHDVRVPVVLATLSYHEDGTPDLSSSIVGPLGRTAHHGAIWARDMVERPGEFVMALKRDDQTVVPGLALATLGAVLHPHCRMDIEWAGRRPLLHLFYEQSPGAYLRERDSFELTKAFRAGPSPLGISAGDIVGCKTFALDRPEQWTQRTIRYEELLEGEPDSLRASLRHKVLIIGDLRSRSLLSSGDRHRVRYGSEIVESVPGGYLLADAVAGLLANSYMKAAFPLPLVTFLATVLLAGVGCLLPIGLATRSWLESPTARRVLWTVLCAVPVACFAAMVLSREYWLVHAGLAGVALTAPMGVSFWIEFARNRHLIPDREIRAVQSFRFDVGETLTNPSRRSTSRRAEPAPR